MPCPTRCNPFIHSLFFRNYKTSTRYDATILVTTIRTPPSFAFRGTIDNSPMFHGLLLKSRLATSCNRLSPLHITFWDVPQGQAKIAQCFNIGSTPTTMLASPEGTAEK